MHAMTIDSATEEAVKRFLRMVEHEYPLEGAVLFGSRARGNHRPDSDADVAVYRFRSAMITVAGLRAGIALMPTGKRRDSLHASLEERLLPMFANQVLPFDMACTKAYAELLATSRAAGSAVIR